ncbi:MAG: prolyl oligopeptidase family serine peptidase [Actinomycetota bacterium]
MTKPKERRFRPADVHEQVMIQELALSPDGSSVVYARRTIEDGKYRKRLWRVDTDGGRPEQLTFAPARDGAPRFSPDGTMLLFLSDRSGRAQPWVMPVGGGEARRVAELEGDVAGAEWSPDGRRLALLAPSGKDRYIVGRSEDPIARRITDLTWQLDDVGKRDQFKSVWVARLAGGKPRRIVKSSFEAAAPLWSRDGKRICFLADRRPGAAIMEEPQLWAVPRRGGEPSELAALKGAIEAASWSPGGRLVAVGVDRRATPEWANRGLFVVEDGKARRLAPERDLTVTISSYGDLVDPDAVFGLAWSDETVIALVSEAGSTLPCAFSLDGGFERLLEREAICTAVAAAAGRVVVVANDGERPGEVYALEGGEMRPLTDHGGRWFEPFRRVPERHRISHPQGHDVDAWLVRARGKRTARPLVVQVHGGPHASHGPTPWLEMIALADAGIHVLYANPRGSTSYGEDFARALHGAWGDPDGSDIMALLDWAVEEGLTSPGRIGVLGLSYGGHMVNWLLGHFPGRFAAGVSENPVTDMVGEFGESDFGVAVDETAVGAGRLPEDIDAFLERSPYLQLHKSDAPLLLLQSEEDLRCPAGQTQLAFTMLRARGAEVEMVLYPKEFHYLVGTGRPDRRVDRIERIVDWFERHLRAAKGSTGRTATKGD